MKRLVRAAGVFILVFTLFIFVYGLINYSSIQEIVGNYVLQYGLFAIFLISFLLDLFPQYLSAHILILIAPLYGMSVFLVLIVLLCGALSASLLGFWLGRRFEEDLFRDVFGKKIYVKIDKGVNEYGKWYAALSAVSPLPYIPILFGALDMEWKTFFLYGIIPRLLGFIGTAIATVLMGDYLSRFVRAF